MGAFQAVVTADAMTTGDREILELAFAPLVTDRAVVGVVDHQPFDHAPAKRNRLIIGRGDHHAVLGRQHAGHLQALDRSIDHLDCADPAGTCLAQCRVPAEMRDGDTDAAGSFQDVGAIRYGDRYVVNDQCGHKS